MEEGLAALHDAEHEVVSVDGRLGRAYDAGRIAATAVVRCHGLRVRAQNHHEMVLKTAGLLGGAGLAQALDEFDRVRHMRAEAEYGWEDLQFDERVGRALKLARRVLILCAAELRACRPSIAQHIQPPD